MSYPQEFEDTNGLQKCIYSILTLTATPLVSVPALLFAMLLTLTVLRRSAVKVCNTNARRCLYLCIVRSNLAYASQVWNPQSVQLLQDLERIQQRATKFILLLPFRTDTPYKSRLLTLKLLPLCYWYEYLDLILLYKVSQDLVSIAPEVLPNLGE